MGEHPCRVSRLIIGFRFRCAFLLVFESSVRSDQRWQLLPGWRQKKPWGGRSTILSSCKRFKRSNLSQNLRSPLALVPFWLGTRKGLYRLCIFAEINFKRESTKSTKYMFYLSFLGNICKGMSGSPCQWALPSRRWVLFNFEDEGGRVCPHCLFYHRA